MKSSHTRQPLHTQQTAEKSEKPFFGGNREKNKQRDNAFFQAKKIDGNQDTAMEQEADAVAQKVTMAQQAPVKSSQRMGQMSVQKKGAEEEKDAKATQKKEKKDEKEEGKVQKKDEDKKDKEGVQKGAEEEKDSKSPQKKEKKDEKEEGKPQKKEEGKKDKEDVQKKGAEEEKDAKATQKKEKKDDKEEGKVQKKEKNEEKDDKAAPQKKEDQPKSEGEKTEGKHENNEQKFERLLNKSKDGGSPLPAKVRKQLEHQMGANFEKVRIHSGQDAVELCNLSKAQAFTHGDDIYFNAAKFDPESAAGMSLLAHELTHVIQQNGPRK